jgi:cell division protein FtsQ
MRRVIKLLALAAAIGGAAVVVDRIYPDVTRRWLTIAMIDDVDMVATAMGFKLDNVLVEGRRRATASDILAAVDTEQGAPILSIDLDATRDAIERLPWVARARVERRLPDTLHIVLEERAPFALWQRGDRYTLIDRSGAAITDVPEAHDELPLVVGTGAPARAATIIAAVAVHPSLAARARAYALIGERRWNLHFDSVDSGVVVRLPEADVTGALDRLAALERDHRILERDIEYVDMRLPDRLVVRPRQVPETGTATVGPDAKSFKKV